MDAASLQRLRSNLSMADEEALVALANRGLYRRALKDLEQYTQLSIEETNHALLVRGPGWCVTMPPEGPAAAKDDSGATGVTRFIVAATIYLREHWLADQTDQPSDVEPAESKSHSAPVTTEIDASTSPVAEVSPAEPKADSRLDEVKQLLVQASIDDLTRWSGKGVFLQATARLKSITDYRILYAPTLAIDFTSEAKRVLLMTDRPELNLKRLLAQFKTTAAKSELAFWVTLAVLVLKREAGEDLSNVNVLESDITEAIREDRLRVAARCQKLLASATISGLAHPSTRMVERFETCAVAAEAARFPRLARLINSIASDIQLQIQRSAAADPQRMIERVLTAQAIVQAAALPDNAERAELFGRSRSQYLPSGPVDMHGLGAYGWRADSGFEGVTGIFWDQANQRFLTASQSRGEGQDRAFTLQSAYEAGLGWTGSQSLRNHCRQHLRLEDTKLNWEGRLSSTSNCSVTVMARTNVEEIDFGKRLADSWTMVTEQARRVQPLGLRIASSSDALVILKPEQWGNRWFDELEQQFVWELVDRAGQVLQVRVPWNDLEETSIEFLETIKPERENLWGLLGRITVKQSRLSVYPLTLLSTGAHQGDTVLCPHFDQNRLQSRNQQLLEQLRTKHGRARSVQVRMADAEEDPLASVDLRSVPKAVRDLLTQVERLTHGAIETGAVQMNELAIEQIKEAQRLSASLGLQVLEQSLATIVSKQSLEVPSEKSGQAAAILQAAYVVRLAGQAAANLCLHG